MFKLLSKNRLTALLALLSLNTFSLMAQEYDYSFEPMDEECCYFPECNRIYIGAFGGETFSNSSKLTQTGTAFFQEASGGPLAIDARGHSGRNSSGFGGVQIGYEWSQCPINIGCSDWSITPAAELEAYFFRQTKKGHLINAISTDRLPEHDFANSFPMNVGLYLINGVFTLNHCCLGKFSPYVGGGVGFANIFIRKADSQQVSPPESGVNHFNSNQSDSDWAFAAQVKTGVRYNICGRFHIFGEYRFSYIDTSSYLFGSTVYPNHAPTSTWNVDVKGTCYNAFAFGVQFDLN